MTLINLVNVTVSPPLWLDVINNLRNDWKDRIYFDFCPDQSRAS